MIKRIVILIAIFSFSQTLFANIATDLANGVDPKSAIEGAKVEGVLPEDAVVQLINEGVETVEAVEIVQTVYGLTGDCGLTQDVAISQMTETGVPQDLASEVVQNRCGEGDCDQTVAPIDSIITAALDTLPEEADTAPLVALFPGCGIAGLDQPPSPPAPTSNTSSGGTLVSPS